MDLTQASEIARAFHRAVIARWPEFAQYASLRATGDLVFEVPRCKPSEPKNEAPLTMTADVDLDETIVAFGGGHSHGGGWRTSDDPDCEFSRVISFVEEILEERVLGYSTAHGSGGLDSKEAIDAVQNVVRIRSWRGTYDRG